MNSIKGQLLVADPGLADPNFFRTVVLMVQHDESGALGLVLNRPTETTVRSAWEQVSEGPCLIEGLLHNGGPCEGPVMAVHTHPDTDGMEILPGLFFSTDRDALESLVGRNDILARLFVGYAGWAPGQLETEVNEGGWLIAPPAPQVIFEESDNLWLKVLREIKDAALPPLNPKVIPEDPSYN